ncbi:beta-sandwich domain-containing protein [Paenimyroides ceti]
MLLLGYNTLHSQTLQGVVVNEQNTFLNNVSVILKSNENKTIAYRFTGADGSFSFTDLEAKEYLLQCNSLGYEKQLITIDLSKEKTKKINIILIEKPEELQEVIIEVPVALKQKKDTVTYNVKSFLDGTEYTVEDLLKKLPGIQVDENGTIKVGNQEIEKIMVEGDDFFEKGYKILSKNMPVKPLKEVELLQNYSNNKHLKGIENSDKVALNLKLEDDAKRQWFGNFDAGYGVASENRYTAYSNLMNFGKKDKYYFLTNLNNIGDDSTGDISHLIRSSNDFVVGDDQMAQQFLSLAPSTASLRDNRTNFNNAEMLSLNSIFTLLAKSKLKAIAFLNTNEQNFYRNSYDWFSDGQTSFENKEDYFMRQKRLSAFGKFGSDS